MALYTEWRSSIYSPGEDEVSLHQCETLKDAEISWDESYKMKPMDEDDIYYALFSMDPNGMISDIIWENELDSDRLGLHRFAPIQSNLLKFDPARISD